MDEHRYDEEHLGRLLRALPPAPAGWVEAAKQLPQARAELEDIVARAEADAAFRAALMADMEQALRDAGHEPTPQLLRDVRARLEAQG